MSEVEQKKFEGWTTGKEILFLDGMMKGTNRGFNPKVSINRTLQNYLSLLPDRTWDDGIDVPAIRLHAQSLLAKCR